MSLNKKYIVVFFAAVMLSIPLFNTTRVLSASNILPVTPPVTPPITPPQTPKPTATPKVIIPKPIKSPLGTPVRSF